MRNEAFLPSRHGFPCVLPSPEREDFGLGTPTPGAFGLSAGAAWMALDRYLAGRPLPDVESDTESRDAVLRMLVRRQKEALARSGWLQLRDWQSLPDRGVPGRKGLAERSRAEFRRLRQSLDDGTPVMLYLVLAQGRHADPSHNVAVLAYDYELDRRARRASVRVYDPSRPGNDNVRLVFHAGADKAFDGRLAVQTPVRGFFCVPYDRPEPAALTLHGVGNEDARIETLLAVQGSAADASFEALGRGRDGRLLHVRRRRSGGYATEHVDVDVLDGCDVEQAAFVGSGRSVLWTSKGELIDCRRRPGLGWRARRITDTRTHGTFDGTATGVARERGRVSLFACGTGRLMHFHRGRLPAWEAEHIDAGPLGRAACVGTPAGVRLGSAMHVVARTRTGELMHARWRARGGWTAENVTARAGDRARFLIDGDPILLGDRRARALTAVCRSKNGSVLMFRWTERKGWRAHDLSAAAAPALRDTLRSESAITAAIEPDGTVHAVGRTADGGLLHAWCTPEGTTGAHDLTSSRPLIGSNARIEGAPSILSGPGDALHVLARRDAQLLLFRWAHNADWSVENITSERDRTGVTRDALASAAGSVAHAALLDDEGRVHHAVFTPRGGTARRLRLPTWLVDVLLLPLTITGILADAVSALIGVTKKGSAPRATERHATASDGTVARPRHVPAEVLPRLPEEPDQTSPLPLLDEAPAASGAPKESYEAAEANAADTGGTISAEPAEVPSRDDWSWDGATADETEATLAGPLDHLLSFGDADADAKTDETAATDSLAHSDVAIDSPEGENPATELPAVQPRPAEDGSGATGDVAMDDPARAETASGEDERTAETAISPDGDGPTAETAISPEDDTASSANVADAATDAAAPASEAIEVAANQSAMCDVPAADDSAPADVSAAPVHAHPADTPVDTEAADDSVAAAADEALIIVYPEPEKRKGKAARKTNGKPSADIAKKLDAKSRVNDEANGDAPSRVDDAPLADTTSVVEDVSHADATPPVDDASHADETLAVDDPSHAEATSLDDSSRQDSTTGSDEPPPESADPLPLLDDGTSPVEPLTHAEPEEPWALPKFEVASSADDWNAPDDEPWSVTPIEGLESTSKGPDTDDWNLPPVDGLEASEPAATSTEEDWNLPPVEGLEQDVASADKDESPAPVAERVDPIIEPTPSAEPRRSIADTDDDWNLPDDAPAIVPEPIEAAAAPSLDVMLPTDEAPAESAAAVTPASAEADAPTAEAREKAAEATSAAGSSDQQGADADSTALPELTVIDASSDGGDSTGASDEDEPVASVEPATVSAPEPPRRKKWQNPALEGLPLLDDEDDDPPPKPAPKPAAAPAARKKPKKPSANEMERIIALAEANQPELLPPD